MIGRAEASTTDPNGDQAAGRESIEQDVAVVLHVERTAGVEVATVERIPIDLDRTHAESGDAGSPRGVVI
jgi:hypothetical protein